MTERSATKWAEIDTSAIRHNTDFVRQLVGPTTAVMAVVKANAYGHGALPAARAAIEGGASWLGVSSVEEGIELRKAGVTTPILNLGYTPPSTLSAAIAAGLSLTLYDRASLALLKSSATEIGVHVKVDTGMHRLGSPVEDAVRLAREVHADARLRLAGFWTHFADADRDLDFTRVQLRAYLAARDELRRTGIDGFLSHASNSAGLLYLPEARLDLVRAGLVLYGVRPRPASMRPELRPALAWRTIVTNVQTVSAGESVGYGRRFTARQASRIATIAVGYADGLHRQASGRGRALVRETIVPLAGAVSMDQAALDVSEAPEVQIGDVVTLIGQDGEHRLTADDLADASGTISYEVLCAISGRVPRRY